MIKLIIWHSFKFSTYGSIQKPKREIYGQADRKGGADNDDADADNADDVDAYADDDDDRPIYLTHYHPMSTLEVAGDNRPEWGYSPLDDKKLQKIWKK